jgi:multidrug efflux pump subunit AcrA (membrane-fusion protein)
MPAGRADGVAAATARRAAGFHTIYVLAGDAKNAALQAVQIKTGISDGISTEVVSGLDEGAQVVTGMVSTGAATPAAASNPFGGGPRRF